MKRNKESLYNAKKNKNDEFYTRLEDIENELSFYNKKDFDNKIIYLNCDSEKSAFWEFFKMRFELWNIKELIATHYNGNEWTYRFLLNKEACVQSPKKDNGDFRNQTNIDYLKKADIIITNPPFSLFREYMAILKKYNKKFLIIGNLNAITYKNVFPLIQKNLIWCGASYPKKFKEPNGNYKKFGNINWYTNLNHKKQNEKISLHKKYNKIDYPKYDNYDAIEVSRTKNIPIDYKGVMGVPISFLLKYNKDQFEIVGELRPKLNGLTKFRRVLIKHKKLKGDKQC